MIQIHGSNLGNDDMDSSRLGLEREYLGLRTLILVSVLIICYFDNKVAKGSGTRLGCRPTDVHKRFQSIAQTGRQLLG